MIKENQWKDTRSINSWNSNKTVSYYYAEKEATCGLNKIDILYELGETCSLFDM